MMLREGPKSRLFFAFLLHTVRKPLVHFRIVGRLQRLSVANPLTENESLLAQP